MSEKCQTLVAEGDAIQQDPIAQQHELLVSEIESTDGHLGTALRFVVLTVVVINLPNLVFSFKTVYNTGARHRYYPCMGSRFPVLFGSGILSVSERTENGIPAATNPDHWLNAHVSALQSVALSNT